MTSTSLRMLLRPLGNGYYANSIRKDSPASLVRAVLRIGAWVIRFTFSFQFSSLRTAAFAEPLASSIQYILLVIRLKYEPTDEDHKIAKDKTLAVEDTGKLAIIWVDLKR